MELGRAGLRGSEELVTTAGCYRGQRFDMLEWQLVDLRGLARKCGVCTEP